VVTKFKKLDQGANLLHMHYAKQMYQIVDLDKFGGAIMNQVLDHLSISEVGQIVVTFLEETEADL
jgi:site-specific recombinase, resolvase family, putative